MERREDPRILRRSGGNECGVNATGAEILDHLDGRHTIDQIGAALAEGLGVAPGEAFSAKVAFFVAQLGELGFLAEPFHARIVFEATDA